MESDGLQRRNIVIIGGGIIGCTSAYFITRHPCYNPSLHTITILEATGIASGASGKAGGLLASWAYPACIVPLSFKLHEELATEHGGAQRWGYRKLQCGSLSAKVQVKPGSQDETTNISSDGSMAKISKGKGKSSGQRNIPAMPADLNWLDLEVVTSYEQIGDQSTTAQVHPHQFTTSMATLAQEKGTSIILGVVKKINSTANRVHSVTYEDKSTYDIHTLPATDIVLSAGPWTSELLPKAPITALRAHSITLSANLSPIALFTNITLPQPPKPANSNSLTRKANNPVSPEIYPRPNNEIYACGEGDTTVPLPASTELVQVDAKRCQDIIEQISSISPALAKAEVQTRQACYLPCLENEGGPLIGPTGVEGLLLAAGHSCWGIQNSCATGKLISEFLWEGRAKSADVESLDPRRVVGGFGARVESRE